MESRNPFNDDKLLELARMNKPPLTYAVDELIRSHGHEALRHPDFNIIELI